MKVTGSGGVGLLVLEAEPGEEIITAAVGALRASGAPFAWVVARGTLREAMVEGPSRAGGVARMIEGAPLELASASGVWRENDATLTLSGVLARELDRGADVVAGRLAVAVAEQVEIVCFLAGLPPIVTGAPSRAPSATGAGAPPAQAAPAPVAPAPAPAPLPTPTPILTPPPVARPQASDESPHSPHGDAPAGGAPPAMAPAQMPPKPVRRASSEETAVYPEPGDRVTHFAFGECSVESSDGDRIHLKQDKDGRVREVSLAMLRIETSTLDAEGRKHFKLQRKN